MSAREGSGGHLEVTVRVALVNPRHNHDKAVTLFLEVPNDTQVVVGRIAAKDNKKGRDATATIVLPISALKTDPPTQLRITMAHALGIVAITITLARMTTKDY